MSRVKAEGNVPIEVYAIQCSTCEEVAGFGQVRHEDSVHREARTVPGDHRHLSKLLHEPKGTGGDLG